MADYQERQEEFITVNQAINSKPQLGPIPGEQVIAWVVILMATYIICKGIFGLDWIPTLLVAAWGIGSWWALTGDASWKFLSKFQGVPRVTLGNATYTSLLRPPTSNRRSKLTRSKFKSHTRPHKRRRPRR